MMPELTIADLPPEILTEVFAHVIVALPVYCWLLAGVSRRWRQVIASTLQFWASIHADVYMQPDHVAMMVERARNHPSEVIIDIATRDRNPLRDDDAAFDHVSPDTVFRGLWPSCGTARRVSIRALFNTLERSAWVPVFEQFAATAVWPHTQDFQLVIRAECDCDNTLYLRLNAPALAHLLVRSVKLAELRVTAVNLTTVILINVDVPWTELRVFLIQHSAALLHATLGVARYVAPQETPPVVLPILRDLTLREWDGSVDLSTVLGLFTLPPTVTITLDGTWHAVAVGRAIARVGDILALVVSFESYSVQGRHSPEQWICRSNSIWSALKLALSQTRIASLAQLTVSELLWRRLPDLLGMASHPVDVIVMIVDEPEVYANEPFEASPAWHARARSFRFEYNGPAAVPSRVLARLLVYDDHLPAACAGLPAVKEARQWQGQARVIARAFDVARLEPNAVDLEDYFTWSEVVELAQQSGIPGWLRESALQALELLLQLRRRLRPNARTILNSNDKYRETAVAYATCALDAAHRQLLDGTSSWALSGLARLAVHGESAQFMTSDVADARLPDMLVRAAATGCATTCADAWAVAAAFVNRGAGNALLQRRWAMGALWLVGTTVMPQLSFKVSLSAASVDARADLDELNALRCVRFDCLNDADVAAIIHVMLASNENNVEGFLARLSAHVEQSAWICNSALFRILRAAIFCHQNGLGALCDHGLFDTERALEYIDGTTHCELAEGITMFAFVLAVILDHGFLACEGRVVTAYAKALRLGIEADAVSAEYKTEAALALEKVTPIILSVSEFTPALVAFLRDALTLDDDWSSGFGGLVVASDDGCSRFTDDMDDVQHIDKHRAAELLRNLRPGPWGEKADNRLANILNNALDPRAAVIARLQKVLSLVQPSPALRRRRRRA